jgi:hypothetical protein
MTPDAPVRARDRVFAVLLALPVVAGGAIVGFGGLVFSNLRCDESCETAAAAWQHDPDAWRWTAQAVLAGGVFVASLVLAALLLSGRGRGRGGALAAGIGLLLAWILFLNT